MLDIQIHGVIEKIANEAPIPVLHQQHEKTSLGGCGNVAMNLLGLGCSALHIISRIGIDQHGKDIQAILDGIPNASYTLFRDASYCTTVKTRGFAEKKIIFRYDIENKAPITDEHVGSFQETFDRILESAQFDGIIMSDYNKGFLTKEITQYVISKANKMSIPTFVDPKNDYTKYIGCSLFKPNKKELEDIFNLKFSFNNIQDIHRKIQATVLCKDTLVTLSEHGMTYMNEDTFYNEKTTSSEVHDVTGAGDVVISVFAFFYKSLEKGNLVKLATWMGTRSVRHMGTYVIQKSDLLEANRYIGNTKVISANDLKQMNQPIIITNGCFDILHEGHLSLFRYCKSLCSGNEVFVVALNSDESIQAIKGPLRPINNLNARIAMLNHIDCIDWIVVFTENTPYELYKDIRPNILVKGGDYSPDSLIGREFCKEVRVTNFLKGLSTTNIIQSICLNHT